MRVRGRGGEGGGGGFVIGFRTGHMFAATYPERTRAPALNFYGVLGETDLRDVLSSISVPTLVLHVTAAPRGVRLVTMSVPRASALSRYLGSPFLVVWGREAE